MGFNENRKESRKYNLRTRIQEAKNIVARKTCYYSAEEFLVFDNFHTFL